MFIQTKLRHNSTEQNLSQKSPSVRQTAKSMCTFSPILIEVLIWNSHLRFSFEVLTWGFHWSSHHRDPHRSSHWGSHWGFLLRIPMKIPNIMWSPRLVVIKFSFIGGLFISLPSYLNSMNTNVSFVVVFLFTVLWPDRQFWVASCWPPVSQSPGRRWRRSSSSTASLKREETRRRSTCKHLNLNL